MSKKANEEEIKQEKALQLPAYVDELLKNGTAILTASSREELAEMVNEIPAECKYGAGAIGKNHETGAFTLQVDLIK